jgi:hypothetical protein
MLVSLLIFSKRDADAFKDEIEFVSSLKDPWMGKKLDRG